MRAPRPAAGRPRTTPLRNGGTSITIRLRASVTPVHVAHAQSR
jgi:hypothetical protein